MTGIVGDGLVSNPTHMKGTVDPTTGHNATIAKAETKPRHRAAAWTTAGLTNSAPSPLYLLQTATSGSFLKRCP